MEPPSFKYVKVELEENVRIAILKYNRPRSGNSLHPDLVAEMLSALKWAEAQSEIRVIVQTGEGRFFCTGMELLDAQAPMSFALGSDFHMLNKTLISCEKILIAAVNGPAAGYGVSSLALFDLVYCVPDAYFFTPFVSDLQYELLVRHLLTSHTILGQVGHDHGRSIELHILEAHGTPESRSVVSSWRDDIG